MLAVAYGGQGGFGDVVLHPQYANNRYVYYSYAEAGSNSTYGAVVARALLTLDANGGGSLGASQVLWRNRPKSAARVITATASPSAPTANCGITSRRTPAGHACAGHGHEFGKVIRLNDDGSVPADNPFANQGGVAAQVWSLGYRNLLGIAFDGAGRPDPRNGPARRRRTQSDRTRQQLRLADRLQRRQLRRHPDTRPPDAPRIQPTRSLVEPGHRTRRFRHLLRNLFPYFKGHGFIGGLYRPRRRWVRIQFDGITAREAERYAMGHRIREVEQGPDGAIWLLEDGAGGRLLKLTPKPL